MMRKIIAVALCGLMFVCATFTYAQTIPGNTIYLPMITTAVPEPQFDNIRFYYNTSCTGDPTYVAPSSTVNNVRIVGLDTNLLYASGSTYRFEWWLGNDEIFTDSGTVSSDGVRVNGGELIFGTGSSCQGIFPDATFEVRIFLNGERVETLKITTRN